MHQVDTRSCTKRKCTKWPQTDFKHLTVISTLYARKIYLWGSNCCPFRCISFGFQDTRSPQIRTALNDPQTKREDLTVISTLYGLDTYPRRSNFSYFCSTTNCFRDTRPPKIGNVKSVNSQKYSIYIKSLHLRPKFWSVSPYDQRSKEYQLTHCHCFCCLCFRIQGRQKSKMHRVTPNWT